MASKRGDRPMLAQPRDAAGRYAEKTPCDACGKPITGDHVTDEEVCGGNDGPGFYLCERKRCEAMRPETVEGRRDLYTRQRAENDRKESER
jgi:hypothetical protein